MTPLLRRIILEKRALVLPLAIALAANVFAYVVVVRPLEVKSAGAADRARQPIEGRHAPWPAYRADRRPELLRCPEDCPGVKAGACRLG